MKITGVVDITSYDVDLRVLLHAANDMFGNELHLAMPLSSASGQPRHVQVLLFADGQSEKNVV